MQVLTQGVPTLGAIGHGLANLAFRQYLFRLRVNPRSQLIDDGKRRLQAQFFAAGPRGRTLAGRPQRTARVLPRGPAAPLRIDPESSSARPKPARGRCRGPSQTPGGHGPSTPDALRPRAVRSLRRRYTHPFAGIL